MNLEDLEFAYLEDDPSQAVIITRLRPPVTKGHSNDRWLITPLCNSLLSITIIQSALEISTTSGKYFNLYGQV